PRRGGRSGGIDRALTRPLRGVHGHRRKRLRSDESRDRGSAPGRGSVLRRTGLAIAEEDLIVLGAHVEKVELDLRLQTGEVARGRVDVTRTDAQLQFGRGIADRKSVV